MVFLYTRIMKRFKKTTSGKIIFASVITLLCGVIAYGIFLFIQKRNAAKNDDGLVDLLFVEDQDSNNLDTDGDGVPDWEEALWVELSPHNPDSDGDGVSDYKYLQQKKRNYEEEINAASGITEKISESDRLGRSLYLALATLSEEGDLDGGDRELIIQNVTRYISDLNISEKIYTSDDFYIVDNTYEESMLYRETLGALTEKYPMHIKEFALILNAPTDLDLYALEIQNAVIKYQAYLDELERLSVPSVISVRHIELTNILSELLGILKNLTQNSDDVDDIVVLASVLQSQSLLNRTVDVLYDIGIYFEILDDKDSWGDQNI